MVQSEIEGGVYLSQLAPGTVLEIQTVNRVYTVVTRKWNDVRISGHPEFCPEPVEATIHGSTWGGAMLKQDFIGRGMHLEFQIPSCAPITTTRILGVREK
jgi:hypothetical protein